MSIVRIRLSGGLHFARRLDGKVTPWGREVSPAVGRTVHVQQTVLNSRSQ